MKNVEHILVAINEEGEHEIIFVSNDIKEINRRAMSFTDECFVYSCGVKAYHEALRQNSFEIDKTEFRNKVEKFVNANRKINWEAKSERGQFCIGEDKLYEFIERILSA